MKTVTERPSFQGDLMIQRIEALPEGLTELHPQAGSYVVAHSETGHHHVIEARPTTKLYGLPEEIYECFLVVSDQPVTLDHMRSHDTHETLEIPPGSYRIRRQREYTPEGYRRAAD